MPKMSQKTWGKQIADDGTGRFNHQKIGVCHNHIIAIISPPAHTSSAGIKLKFLAC